MTISSCLGPPFPPTIPDRGKGRSGGKWGGGEAPILDTKEISHYRLESLQKKGTFLRSSLNGR